MKLGIIDYASSYFKYKTPTPIRGEPTHKSLKRLKLELQANASSVETDLGGGNHGYLGLILTDQEYATIPHTAPFVPPTYPAALNIPSDATQIQALQLKDEHQEAKRLYLECKNVEKASLRHIQDAIEEKYLESLVDEYTNLLNGDVPDMLTYLFWNYGKVRSEEVAQKEAEVMTLSWQPTEPMVLLTRPLEQLQKLATQANIPCTDNQILEKGLSLIRATRDFEYALTQWENKQQNQKTWATFKTHFHEAQLQLKQIRGPTMQQAGYHHANSLAQQIQEQLQERDSQMIAHLHNIPSLTTSSISSSEPSTSSSEEVYSANMVQDATQLEILKLLRQIQLDMKPQQQQNTNRPSYTNRPSSPSQPTRRPRILRATKTPDDATLYRPCKGKYCWTHGACGHSSANCKDKAPGHRDEATKENKMNGSKAWCN